MTQLELNLPSKENLREVPKDQILEATVVSVERKKWKDFISADKLDRFKDPEQENIFIKYDCKGFIRTEKFKYIAEPTTTSRLGRYLVKYDEIKVGQTIKVQFDEKGESNILLAK